MATLLLLVLYIGTLLALLCLLGQVRLGVLFPQLQQFIVTATRQQEVKPQSLVQMIMV